LRLKFIPGIFLAAQWALAADPPPAARIASAVVAADEMLVMLLDEQDPNFEVVAYSHLATHPDYSNVANKVAPKLATFGANMETLLLTRPSHAIVASYNRPEVAQLLSDSGIRIVRLENFTTFAHIFGNLNRIATSVGKQA